MTNELSKQMMGVDIVFDERFNLIFDSNNTFSLTKDYRNLAQAIINRLITPIGFNKFYPRYGSYLHRINSKGTVESTIIYAKQVIYEALLQEPRIQTIENIDCKYIVGIDNKLFLNISITVLPIESIEKFNFVWDYFIR